ncbi:hypothetical protein M3Y98_00987500 [Aphelenchoides besseyi]|nr:hypothetical protein M3Y98_00987500 [Aphelenchoides besseyi]
MAVFKSSTYRIETNVMVDTFNGTMNEICIDTSAIENPIKRHYLGLEIMCFMDGSTVCGLGFCETVNQRLWFNGNFDINFVLRIDTIKFLGGINYILNTEVQPATLNAYLSNRFYSYTADLNNGNLSDVKVTNMAYHIWSPVVSDGKLFGFPVEETRINTKMLYEISLIDGSKTEHKVKEDIIVEVRNRFIPALWTKNKLLVRVYDRNNDVSSILKFDISQMKWEKTTIQVEGRIESMTLTDGLLIVHAYSSKDKLDSSIDVHRDKESNQFIYRFQYEAIDSLANLTWLSMQRYSARNPSFREFFLSKVPKNLRLRPL